MVAAETRRPDQAVVMFVSAVTISGKHSGLELLIRYVWMIIRKKMFYKIFITNKFT